MEYIWTGKRYTYYPVLHTEGGYVLCGSFVARSADVINSTGIAAEYVPVSLGRGELN